MALVKGTNSYCTVAEADTYFADRLDVAAWTTADATSKAQALVTATSVLDEQPWTGTAISEDQPLAFPRSGYYFDPRIGANITFSATPPTRITIATMELAYHFLNNDGLQDDAGSATNIKVGTITLERTLPPSLIPAVVRRAIKPMLVNAGSNGWWRAN
jgi:hypothetical protein